MLLARFLGPPAEAAEHPGDPVPADCYAILVVGLVLRMDLRALLDGLLQAVLRRQCCELVSIRAVEHVGAEQHALARAAIIRVRIADLPDRKIRIGDAAIDPLVLLPKAALELQADFGGC